MPKPSLPPSGTQSAGARYSVAVLAVSVALLVKLGVDQIVDTGAPFLLFPLAILAAAWFGGLRPGLLATLLSTAAAVPMFLSPPSAPVLGPGALALRTVVFLLQGIGISLIAHAFELERRRADADAARATAALDELRKKDRQLLLITDSLPVLVSYIDAGHRYRFVNKAYEEWFGLPRREVVGQHTRDVLGEAAYEAVRPFLDEALSGRAVTYEREVPYARGGARVVDATYVPHAGEDGRIEGLIALVADASERKRAEEDLRMAKEESEAANRMKDQFLATLSHELRTPLNAIFGWAQLLRSGKLDPQTLERGIDTIERNARSQKKLIEDLLDVSRIVSGKLQLEPKPVDLAEVVEAALETVAPAARAKGIAIERGYGLQPGPVLGDAQRLQQIVWNLLSNAVKFTPEGGRVTVSLETKDGEAEIAVTDTGQGIGPEFLPFVFDRFRQADASSTRRHGGLGLGLSIVRHLAELHGGSVRAESPGPGQGSTFTVSLPLATRSGLPEARRSPAEGEGGERVSLAGVRVLVVDDEADARELLEQILTGARAEVVLAASAPEALEALARFRPDVLVSDIGLPGEDGYDLIRKARERGFAGPAAALTAFARAEDRRRALLAGFQIHLAKPVHPGELTAVVASLADRARSTP